MKVSACSRDESILRLMKMVEVTPCNSGTGLKLLVSTKLQREDWTPREIGDVSKSFTHLG